MPVSGTLLILMLCTSAAGEQPFFEEEPFDQVTLDEHNDNLVLKVQPLERPLPERPRPTATLTLRLVDHPDKLYQAQWHTIEKIEFFEDSLLRKANELAAAGEGDQAYDYFKFLEEKYPQTGKLAESVQNYLFQEAGALYREKQYDGALAVLRELHGRNSARPELDKVMGLTTEKLVEEYIAKGNFAAVRTLIRNLADAYPGQAVAVKWSAQLEGRAAALFGEARAAAAAGQFGKAGQLCRKIKAIRPELPGARELAEKIHRSHPRVVVGVSVAAADPRPGRLNGWASLRSSRLLYRPLMEFTGPGTEGGTYACPVGQLQLEKLGRRLALQITPDVAWASGAETLTGYQVARRLMAMADPADGAYRVLWAELFSSVGVDGVYRVEADLRRPFVRSDALLQTVLIPYGTSDADASPPLSNGPYIVDSRSAKEVIYQANPQYFVTSAGQPKELAERPFDKGAMAIRALLRDEIQVLDRISPWGLSIVREEKDIVVDRYAVPLVHCLIPNMRKPLTAKRAFRRALAYGIHREAILGQITGKEELPGCQVISGPFPPGEGLDDRIGYAYDREIEPRGYEPRLAIALAGISVNQLAATIKKRGEELKETPRLVLAHSGGEIARSVCPSIKRQLELIGVPIELKELPGPAPRQIPDDVDLLYAELAVWEPVVDARRLLGSKGMTAGCSSYMSLALRRLEEATDWQEVHSHLRRVHLVAHRDVAVVPLWQLTDYFAYRESFKGIGTRPITLYQNVEQWRPAFQYPEGE